MLCESNPRKVTFFKTKLFTLFAMAGRSLSSLPEEILSKIVSYLNNKDLTAFQATCKKYSLVYISPLHRRARQIGIYGKSYEDCEACVTERPPDVYMYKYLYSRNIDLGMFREYPLRMASRMGLTDVVRYLAEVGSNLKACNNYSLRWSVNNGHQDVVEFLLSNGTSIGESKDLLYWAAMKGHSRVVETLLKFETEWDYEKCTIAAVTMGHLEIVQLLSKNVCSGTRFLDAALQEGKREIAEYLIENISSCDVTHLIKSAELGYTKVVKNILNTKSEFLSRPPDYPTWLPHMVEVGATDEDFYPTCIGYSLLLASIKGHLEILQLLEKAGACINFRGGLPLLGAVSNNRVETTQYLLSRGAQVPSNTHYSFERFNLPMVKLLYEKRSRFANLKFSDIFVSAIYNNRRRIITFLLGKEINLKNSQHRALFTAVNLRREEICRELLQHGADPNARQGAILDEAITPYKESFSIFKLLLEAGADLDRFGEKLLNKAVRSRNLDVINLLLERKVDPNSVVNFDLVCHKLRSELNQKIYLYQSSGIHGYLLTHIPALQQEYLTSINILNALIAAGLCKSS